MVSAQLSVFAFRLLPGDDLKASLDRLAQEQNITAACLLTCAGSLSQAELRFAGNSEPTLVKGPLEICSLTGMLSPDGSHLHLSVADRDGRISGGHIKDGCIVLTTAEIVVGILPGIRFGREFDMATGYRELQITLC